MINKTGNERSAERYYICPRHPVPNQVNRITQAAGGKYGSVLAEQQVKVLKRLKFAKSGKPRMAPALVAGDFPCMALREAKQHAG